MNGISPRIYITDVQSAISMYAASEMPRIAETQQQTLQVQEQPRDTLIGPHTIDIIV